ncbi:NAD-dependent epimerase/dehydratase family protein [candidate division KSB1 bacterium]
MKRVLVTGGAGFIGSHIADRLIETGYNVDIIDNLSTGVSNNINKNAEFYEMDINDDRMESLFRDRKYAAVFHQAAQMNVRVSVEDPLLDIQNNIVGMVKLIDYAVKNNIEHFIFASTGGAIYGEQENFPADENHNTNPYSPYGINKLTGEKYLYYFNKSFGLKYTAMRYANVYGPRQNPFGEAGVVAIFAHHMLGGEKAVIFGTGKQTRDFVYVEDVVNANMLVLEKGIEGCFNIGTGIETDVNTIFSEMAEIISYSEPPGYEPAKKGEQTRSVLDCKKAEQVLGWIPKYNLKKGLEKTVGYFKK